MLIRFAIVGVLGLIFVVGSMIWFANTTSNWKAVDATVTSVHTARNLRHVEWEYTVNGKKYKGSDSAPPAIWGDAEIKENQTLPVRYSPQTPQISSAPQITQAQMQAGGIRIFGALGGLLVWLAIGQWLRKNKARATTKRTPSKS